MKASEIKSEVTLRNPVLILNGDKKTIEIYREEGYFVPCVTPEGVMESLEVSRVLGAKQGEISLDCFPDFKSIENVRRALQGENGGKNM